MDEFAARRELERAFKILEELKLFANNVRQEFGMSDHNLREAERHLGAFYLEMAEEYQRDQNEKAEKEEKKEKNRPDIEY